MPNIDELIKHASLLKNRAAIAGFRAVKSRIIRDQIRQVNADSSRKSYDQLFVEACIKEIERREAANKQYIAATHPIAAFNNEIITSLQKHIPKILSKEQQEHLVVEYINETRRLPKIEK